MKILVIEDDKFFQKFYSSKLAEAGYEVEIASNGKEGLEKVTSFKPNIIILDLIMPEVDGFEVLETLQKQKVTTPILIFSTLGQEDDIAKAKKLGAKDYVNKSYFDLEKLKQKIASLTK